MNTQSVIITNGTAKLLKFIRKHQNVTYETLKAKFDLDFMDLVCLCLGGYLVCTKPGIGPTMFQDGKFSIGPEDSFWASPKTEQFLEERFQRRWQWFIPTTISAIALTVSIAAFIMSLLPQVLEVRLLP